MTIEEMLVVVHPSHVFMPKYQGVDRAIGRLRAACWDVVDELVKVIGLLPPRDRALITPANKYGYIPPEQLAKIDDVVRDIEAGGRFWDREFLIGWLRLAELPMGERIDDAESVGGLANEVGREEESFSAQVIKEKQLKEKAKQPKKPIQRKKPEAKKPADSILSDPGPKSEFAKRIEAALDGRLTQKECERRLTQGAKRIAKELRNLFELTKDKQVLEKMDEAARDSFYEMFFGIQQDAGLLASTFGRLRKN
jgi:hypothetical protein